MKNLNKLLLIVSLIASANAYSLSWGPNVSLGSFSSSGGVFSGSMTFNNPTGGTITFANGSESILAGSTINLQPGATVTLVGPNGTIGTISGVTSYTFGTTVTGADSAGSFTMTASAPSTTPSTPTSTTPAAPSTPTTPATSTTTTPATSGTVPTIAGPRSRVDYDLAKTITANSFKDLEQAKKENGANLNIQYLGNAGSYDQDLKYNSKANGVVLSGTKNFGKFTLGAGFGFENSTVKYKNSFDGVKEKLDSYQVSLSGKYDFTDNLDLASVLTYGSNKHKYNNYSDVKFDSDVLDFQTRLGYKFRDESDENTYVKPYVGLGVTSVKEDSFTVGNVNYGKAKRSSGNATAGIYGQTKVGPVDLYGNLEYEQRFNKKSYHAERSVSLNGAEVAKLAALDYDQGVFNLGLGAKYNVSNNFNLSAGYELYDTKNSIFKVGLGLEF